MYVARLKRQGERIVGLERPVRVSPENSWNSCGYFSPNGRTLIFASTGHKGLPDEPAGGYQRQGGNYRRQFSAGAAICFRGDLAAAGRGQPRPAGPRRTPVTAADRARSPQSSDPRLSSRALV